MCLLQKHISSEHFPLSNPIFFKNSQIYEPFQENESIASRNCRIILNSLKFLTSHLPQITFTLLLENGNSFPNGEELSLFNHAFLSQVISSDEKYSHLIDKLRVEQGPSNLVNDSKNIFIPHLSAIELKHGLHDGTVIQGSFHKSLNNPNEARVFIYDEQIIASLKTNWILISGQQNLNRAVHLDVVGIELLDKSQWSAPSNLINDDANDANLVSISNEDTNIDSNQPSLQPDSIKAKRLKVNQAESVPSGKVVGIIRKKGAQHCGYLKPMIVPTGEKEHNSLGVSTISSKHFFLPLNKRIPPIEIHTSQFEQLENCKIVVTIDNWPPDSASPRVFIVFFY